MACCSRADATSTYTCGMARLSLRSLATLCRCVPHGIVWMYLYTDSKWHSFLFQMQLIAVLHLSLFFCTIHSKLLTDRWITLHTNTMTNLCSCIIFFQIYYFPFPKLLENTGEFPDHSQTSWPIFQIPDFFQTFRIFQTCRHHGLWYFDSVRLTMKLNTNPSWSKICGNFN